MLDMECFTFLNRALESPMSPYVVLATNRGNCTIRGTETAGEGVVSPHGLPVDLLDRCMIVRTQPYKLDEVRHVLEMRCRVEGLAVSKDALDKLAQEGIQSSLRWGAQEGLVDLHAKSVIPRTDTLFNCSPRRPSSPSSLAARRSSRRTSAR